MRSGDYIGPIGSLSLRRPRARIASRTGAMLRENIVDSYLGRAGLGTHGDGPGRRVSGVRYGVFGDPAPVQLRTFGDLCDATGSDVAGALHTAGTSDFFSQIGQATGNTAASGTDPTAAGYHAATGDAGVTTGLGVAGSILGLVGGLWGHQCTIEAARQTTTSPTSSGAPSDVTAQFQSSIAAALTASSTAQQQSTAAALAQQQAAAAASQRNTLMIAGGIGLGVLVLGIGAVVLLRK